MRNITRAALPPETLQKMGLKRDPFAPPKSPRDVFWGNDAAQIQVVMFDAITRPGIAAITGEVGSGKSIAVRMFVENELRRKKQYVVSHVHLHEVSLTRTSHVLKKVLNDFIGDPFTYRELVVIAEKMRTTFEELHATGTRPVIILEDAHLLPTQTLRDLKIVYELGSTLEPLVGIVLVGQQELRTRLDREDLRQLTQRTRVYAMHGLEGDLPQYVAHLFKRCGSDAGDWFDQEALKVLMAYPGLSTPLEVNYACTRALQYAWRTGEGRVTREVVMEVLSQHDDEVDTAAADAVPSTAAAQPGRKRGTRAA